MANEKSRFNANPGYVLARLQDALNTAANHGDRATRERAIAKASNWRSVFAGMVSGSLLPGSRKPIAGIPVWATPKVIMGGFATGELLAEGPILAHEEALARRLGLAVDRHLRGRLNAWFLTAEGRAELLAAAASGAYRIDIPEEAALMVLAWLIDRDEPATARDLLASIAPMIARLRFYPVMPAESAEPEGGAVRLVPVAAVVQRLAGIRTPRDIAAQRETLVVWHLLADRAAALIAETVRDTWPCQHYPQGWHERARAFVADADAERGAHRLCKRPTDGKSNLSRLAAIIRIIVTAPERLTGRDVGMARAILAQIEAVRGPPGGEQEKARRAAELAMALSPTKADLARVMQARLAAVPQERGLSDPEALLKPVSDTEAATAGVQSGGDLAESFGRLLERAREASPEALVERGIIGSAEKLALVVPQLAGAALAESTSDPVLRRLMARLYESFRRRRSLLLLDMSRQVGLQELPWVSATAASRTGGEAARAGARRLARRVSLMAMSGFPQTIMPNRLIRECDALVRAAGLDLVLTQELAADIFMGDITEKFLKAAQCTARIAGNGLYGRYFAMDPAAIAAIKPVRNKQYNTMTAPGLIELARQRAGLQTSDNRSIAANGRVIEQLQILTSHNLACLVAGLELEPDLEPKLDAIVDTCSTFIVAELGRPLRHEGDWRTRLIRRKNAAYAWRQMVFFLSLAGDDACDAMLDRIAHSITVSQPPIRDLLVPFMDGLRRARHGDRLSPSDPGIFLGWVSGLNGAD